MEKLIEMLLKTNGVIVCSSELTRLEIAQAQSCGRFYVDENGFGFAFMPEKYDAIRQAANLIQDVDIILDYAITDKEKVKMIESKVRKV